MSELPRILFVVDTRNWAYADQALNWQSLLAEQYKVDILYLAEYFIAKCSTCSQKRLVNIPEHRISTTLFDYKDYDGVVIFYYKALKDKRLGFTEVDFSKVALCINNSKWKEAGPLKTFNDYLQEPKIVIGCNKNIIDTFSPYRDIQRASQAVNEHVFKNLNGISLHSQRAPSEFTIGWSGDPVKYPNIKNTKMIKEACQKIGVKFSIKTHLTRDQLSEWYNTLDIVVCASATEGGPNMILEAGACGVPVVTTPVGLAPEIILNNKSGLIIPHNDLEAMCNAINKLKNNLDLRKTIATNLKKVVTQHWTYKARLKEIETILKALVA